MSAEVTWIVAGPGGRLEHRAALTPMTNTAFHRLPCEQLGGY